MMFKNPCKKKLKANAAKQLDDWVSNGKPSPPPQPVKEMTVEEFRNGSQSEILVETRLRYFEVTVGLDRMN